MLNQDRGGRLEITERKGRLRAQRYPLETTLRYRVTGQENWLEGMTEDISQSGVLFRTESVVPTGTLVEMNLMLPALISGEPPSELNCQATVVRAVRPSSTGGLSRIAAKVLHYRLQRGGGTTKA